MPRITAPQQLQQLGADAMDNLFDIEITLPLGFSRFSGEAVGNITRFGIDNRRLFMRGDGFTPPVSKVGTYKVTYGSSSMMRPTTTVDVIRSFSVNFRLDAYYQAYRTLAAWKSMFASGPTGYTTPAIWKDGTADELSMPFMNEATGSIRISAMGQPISQNEEEPGYGFGASHGPIFNTVDDLSDVALSAGSKMIVWEFDDVWVSELEEPKFNTGGGAIQTIKAVFQFGNYKDPIYRSYGPIL